MPKIVFGRKEEFEKWLRDITSKKAYSLYADATNLRIVAVPTVSTEPIIYGVYEGDRITEIDELAEKLSTQLNLPLYKVKELEFADFKTR